MRNIVILAIITLLLGGAFFFAKASSSTVPQSIPSTPTPGPETIDITASFTVKTDKIIRSFKAAKYHNQSPDVFITNNDPTKVYVKKRGITWGDFFATLPMELTKECLTTGTKETFCDGKDGTLTFYLNGTEDKDLLDKEIKERDTILIVFTSR